MADRTDHPHTDVCRDCDRGLNSASAEFNCFGASAVPPITPPVPCCRFSRHTIRLRQVLSRAVAQRLISSDWVIRHKQINLLRGATNPRANVALVRAALLDGC
jgi:hypothetical protein